MNIAKVAELTREGRMHPAGIAAFEAGRSNSGDYSYEGATPEFTRDQLGVFRANAAGWTFFERQPASYRKAAISWVVKAKRPETVQRRLEALIGDSMAGRRLAQFTRPVAR